MSSVLNQRCRSADNVSIHPLSKDNLLLLEHFRTVTSKNPKASHPTNTNPTTSAVVSTITQTHCTPDEWGGIKHIASFDEKDIDNLVTPWQVCCGSRVACSEGSQDVPHGGHYSVRERMTLDGLTTSRPRGGDGEEAGGVMVVSYESSESVSLEFDVSLDLDTNSDVMGKYMVLIEIIIIILFFV